MIDLLLTAWMAVVPQIRITAVESDTVFVETESKGPYAIEWSADCKEWKRVREVTNGDWLIERKGFWRFDGLGRIGFFRVVPIETLPLTESLRK